MANGTALPKKPLTPIEEVKRTLAEARDLALSVERLVDELLGSSPDKLVDRMPADRAGVIPGLDADAEHTRAVLADATAALSRLRAVLP